MLRSQDELNTGCTRVGILIAYMIVLHLQI